MAFAQLTYRESLRDIEVCLSAQSAKRYHLGVQQEITRSTLADANELRDWRIYAELAQRLIVQARTLDLGESRGVALENTAYARDSPTIARCRSVFPWALFRTTKAAVQMHTLLDLRGSIPSFIHISAGKRHDVNVLDVLIPEAGAISVMDRGSLDFERLSPLPQARAFFVTRAQSNLDARRVDSAATDRATGIICDQTSPLTGSHSRQQYPAHMRRLRVKDPASGKTRGFLTHTFPLPATTVCARYKSRRHVALFCTWITPHRRIKKFLGTSENAVKSQIWSAVSMDVLVALVKKRLALDAPRYPLLQILSVTLFEKLPLQHAFPDNDHISKQGTNSNQLNLFAV